MSGLYPFDQSLVFFFSHRIYQVDTGLIDCQDIIGSQDTDIWCNDRFSRNTFTVTLYGHVSHDIDISHVLTEEVDGSFCRFGDPFHQFFFSY